MNRNDYIIRNERKEEEREVENLVRNSFYNIYREGCVEHYVLHKMRKSPLFIPELNFVLVKGDKIIGQNVFVKAAINLDSGAQLEIATMGPICISREYQRKGLGKYLLDYSLDRAQKYGIKALCFEGNIDFYGKSGFDYASKYGIRYYGLSLDADSSFFLCKELEKDYLKDIKGEYKTPSIYSFRMEDVIAFDSLFPKKERLKKETQIF